MEYRYRSKHIISDSFQNIDYPPELDLASFFERYSEKCFIISMGSCNSALNSGSYMTTLMFKGKAKILKKNNISTKSVNYCILEGISDAAKLVKSSVDVMILTVTSLGFNSPKSPQYEKCSDIIEILKDKNCKISICVCKNRSYELKEMICSLE